MSINGLERFLEDTKDHVLTVNLDQGLYRDISFGKPNSSYMHFNITTRKGYLFYTGDMGSFTFKRIPDMFHFFRHKEGRINPQYWSGKLEAIDRFGGFEEYSERIAQDRIDMMLVDFLDDLDLEEDEDQKKAGQATTAVNELKRSLDAYESLTEAYMDWDSKQAGGMDLDDYLDGSFTEFNTRFIWCLHAIVHVINVYDTQKEGVENV